ncbi:MAG: phosphatidylglycerophosphate synthase [Pseudohongiellaceae bacterium]|jgi:phosphatidylglycerophosphate synthase
MIDNPFRERLAKRAAPFVKLFDALGLTPNQVSCMGLAIGLAAALLVASGYFIAAIIVWWISRLLDGLDGIYARASNQTSDFGAFLDIQFDMLAYCAMIAALYWQFPQFAWQWLLIMLAYVLCISGALGLGSFENKQGLRDSGGRGLRLAVGLAEGGETGLAYTVFLLFPNFLALSTWIWIAVLIITILARLLLARTELKGYS